MKDVLYSPRAALDLSEIWDFTANRWDPEQAEAYIRQITHVCSELANGSLPGRNADDIQSGYRKQTAGVHVIFYNESPDAILVIRILHGRMDTSRHL